MPVRKKPASTTKKALAKPTSGASKTAAKKTTTKKTASASAKPAPAEGSLDGLAANIVKAIKSGQFDPYIVALDDAITARVNKRVTDTEKSAPKAAPKPDGSKKISPAPKRNKGEPVKVEVGKTYKLSGPAKLAGAKVKFLRFKSDDDKKAVVEMVTGKPGYPKEKRVVVPVSALAAAGR